MLLLIGVWIFHETNARWWSRRRFLFGKSKAKMLNENQNQVTFVDVAGCEEAKRSC